MIWRRYDATGTSSGSGAKRNVWQLDKNRSARRFRDVVLPHLSDALALARWLTGNVHDAEDVVQDACVRALAGIEGFAGENPRAWVLAIVRNTAFTWMAKHRSRALVMVGDLTAVDEAIRMEDALAAGETTNPEAALIRRADAATVEAAITALPLPYREVLVLRDINDLSYKEIATLLSLPIGTVMSRLSRARAHLAAAIKRGQA